MGRSISFLYGLVAYAVFFAVLLYTIAFVGNLDAVAAKTIDSGTTGPLGLAILINVLLMGLFAVQHNVMARPWFKAWWTRIVPEPIERSTFVLLASLLLALLFWQWRPMPEIVWQVDHAVPSTLLWILCFGGFAIALYASFLIDHFDLFGLRQVFLHWRGREYTSPRLAVRSLYKWVRHPLVMGFLIGFWATPTMTQGHLLFAVVITAWTFFGIMLEERDLSRALGGEYHRYRAETPMIVPKPWRPGWSPDPKGRPVTRT